MTNKIVRLGQFGTANAGRGTYRQRRKTGTRCQKKIGVLRPFDAAQNHPSSTVLILD
ncbi:hypothetical protein [Psychrobacter sp. L7]|uniref:hypothetical protein n=1 Tax=Psychrobacter sp. L7 TaxID=1982756 RepID=UPI00156215E7|nr:hypothetical protein [Psychrobacter sp. L7]